MKRILILLSLVFALIFCTSATVINAGAEGDGNRYTVLNIPDGYALTYDGVTLSEAPTLTSLLENIPKEECEIYFNGIRTAEDLTLFGGSITLKGEIAFSGDAKLTLDGARLEISAGMLAFSEGGVRVKRGELKISGGSVTSNGIAVISDFSSSSSVDIVGGSILSRDSTAVYIERGSVSVSAGSLTGADTALTAYTTITLSGSPTLSGGEYDIITDTEITLFEGNSVYRGIAKIKLLSTFMRGRATVTVYAKSPDSLLGITLCDIDGVSHTLTFADGGISGVGESVGFVALPYYVTFYDGDEMVMKSEYIKGNDLALPKNPERLGYIFSGWCSDEGEKYDFNGDIDTDISLYSSFSLAPPTYTLTSQSFTYDGNSRKIELSDINHPLLDGGFLSFKWYKDGEPISSFGTYHGVCDVSDSGSYSVLITLTVGKSSVATMTPAADVVISKRVVTPPIIPPKYYTGAPLTPDVADTDEFTVSPSSGTVTGSYPVLITLRDEQNYTFMGTDSPTLYVDFVIERAENAWTSPLTVPNVYTGQPLIPSVSALFGDVEILFRKRGDSYLYAKAPTEAGEYVARAFVSGSENYTALDGVEVEFVIIAEHVEGISVTKCPDRQTYSAFESFLPYGIEVLAMYNSGRLETVFADSLTFTYQTADSFRYGDGGITVGFGGKSVTLPLTVEKAEYDISNVLFSSAEIAYKGAYITLPVPENLPVGLDGIPLTATVRGGGTAVGEYRVTLEFSTVSRNYRIPQPYYATLTVTPLSCEAVWLDTSFVYDGGEKLPRAFYLDVLGRRVDLTVKGARSLAGEYTATAEPTDANYCITNPSVIFKIEKANYDTSGVFWIGGGEVYDGTEKSVYLTSLPSGVTVIGYVNNRASESGSYVARASLSYDEANYNPPVVPDCNWQILKRDYPTDGFFFSDAEYIYDSLTHYPTLVGEMPVGIDGIILEYVMSGGAKDVIDGKTLVTVSFKSESNNYNLPESINAYVTIFPKEITVSWRGLFVTYNGTYLAPVAYAQECSITVLGGGVSAGEYTVTAASADSNYKIKNSTATLVISKAENKWIKSPSVSDIFYGRVPSPIGEVLSGELIYTYYSTDNLTSPISGIPRAVGKYAVVISSPGDLNHLSIESAPMYFEIVAVVPIALEVALGSSEYPALHRLSEKDISAFLSHNDGTRIKISFKDIEIEYQRGDCVLFGDSAATVKYGGFSSEIKFGTVRADYDMSAVRWEGISAVYDGAEKRPYLTGLPKGVSVIEYVGTGINAGEYTVSAVLEWDRENCNPPIIPETRFCISKMKIPIPSIQAHEYNGESVIPDVSDTALYTVTVAEGKYPGKYPVVFTVRDSENYELEGGNTVTVDFVIEKRKITIEIDSVTLGIFERMPEFTYDIVKGSLLSGDSLNPEFSVNGGRISAAFDMEYYDITVIEGELIRTAKMSPLIAILTLLFILLLLCFVLLALALKRRLGASLSERTSQVVPGGALAVCESPAIQAKGDSTEEKNEQNAEKNEISILIPISSDYANSAISNSLAKDLIRREVRISTDGWKRGIINVDTLSESFSAGERVDVNILKRKSLIPYDTAYIKVLARGVIDKPLEVYANDFSLSAVKMIALAGGHSVKVVTESLKNENVDEKP